MIVVVAPNSGSARKRQRTAPSETSWASSETARATMLANRSRDTGPELAIRRLLHSAGFRYRVNFSPLPGRRITADVAFTRQRIAVFVDGCFWHGCPEHFVEPKSNVDYWRPKIAANRVRDARVSNELAMAGWTVLRFWEHEPPASVSHRIAKEVEASRSSKK